MFTSTTLLTCKPTITLSHHHHKCSYQVPPPHYKKPNHNPTCTTRPTNYSNYHSLTSPMMPNPHYISFYIYTTTTRPPPWSTDNIILAHINTHTNTIHTNNNCNNDHNLVIVQDNWPPPTTPCVLYTQLLVPVHPYPYTPSLSYYVLTFLHTNIIFMPLLSSLYTPFHRVRLYAQPSPASTMVDTWTLLCIPKCMQMCLPLPTLPNAYTIEIKD